MTDTSISAGRGDSGRASHAEGWNAQARGGKSHAEGNGTVAVGENSHAEGQGTKALGEASHVQGKHNIPDTEKKYAHIVGNGASDYERSNAHTLDWNGNAWFAGEIILGGTYNSETKLVEGANKVITEKELNNYKYEFTEEDKTLIVNAVIAALPNGDEVSY